MRQFNWDLRSYEEIKKEFPEFSRIDLSRKENLKKIIKAYGLKESEYNRILKEEINVAIADAEYEKYLDICDGQGHELNENEKQDATAIGVIKAAYRIVFCVDNIENQLFCAHEWGEKKNRPILFKRMGNHKLDPFSIDEETVYSFIQMVTGGGYVTKTINGKSFKCFNACTPVEEQYGIRTGERVRVRFMDPYDCRIDFE